MKIETYKAAEELQSRINSIKQTMRNIDELLEDLEKEPDLISEIEVRGYVDGWSHSKQYMIRGPIQENEVQPIVPSGHLVKFLKAFKKRLLVLESGLQEEFERL